MTLGHRNNQGKPRLDLFPFPDVTLTERSFPLDLVYQGLQAWFYGRPQSFGMAIPRSAVTGISAVLGFGAEKYEPRGWEKGLSFSSTFASAARHAEAVLRGELIDPESGLPHEHHFWCNVMFLAVFTERGRTDLDDRPSPNPAIVRKFEELNRALAGVVGLGGVLDPQKGPPTSGGLN